jgi:hypothetical protein
MGNSQVKDFSALGEKYFPCTGLTPERVYFYVVSLDRPTDILNWISLEELISNKI